MDGPLSWWSGGRLIMGASKFKTNWLVLFFILLDVSKALERVKIGGIFDTRSIYSRTAFRYGVHAKNKDYVYENQFRLESDITELDITDSFEVSNKLCHHLSEGNLAIFGVSNSSSLATIQSYTDFFQVPYISLSMDHNFTAKDSFQLYMRPIYVNAVVDVILNFKWKKLAFYYDSDEGLVRLQQLFHAINKYKRVLPIDTKRIDNVEDAYRSLKDLHLKDSDVEHKVLLDMPTKKAEKILLKIMKDSDIKKNRFHFLLGDLGLLEINISNFKTGGMKIVGFQLVEKLNETATARIFLDKWETLDSYSWPGAGTRTINYEAALAVDAVELFTRAVSSILNQDPTFLQRNRLSGIGHTEKCTDDSEVRIGHGKTLFDMMKKMKYEGITGHVEFDEYGHRKDFTLGIYDVTMTRGASKVAYWSEKDGKTVVQHPRLFTEGTELDENRTRIVTTIIKEPYVMWKKAPSESGEPVVAEENLEGFCIDLTRAVAAKIGFEYRIQFVKDSNYGQIDENGTWNGMVGELIRHEADMAIAPFTITSDRSRVIDFTKPFMSLGISIMIKRPVPTEKHFFSFMDPLSYEIWMCIVFAYIGVSVVLFLVSRFSPNEWHLSDSEQSIANDFSISNSLWFSLGAFMQQGCDISPRSMSGRIVGSVWWFFTLIIISSYTANLAAFLTVERMLTPIDSAEDLARQTEIQYGTINSGSTKAFFKNSEYQTYKRMYTYMQSVQPSVFVNAHEEGIERVRNSNGKYAYITESTTIEYISSRKPCNTLQVGSKLNSDGFGIGTPVGSDLKEKLNFAVLGLRENGQLTKWQEYWFNRKECPSTNANKDGAQSALDLSNVAGIFYILIAGLVTAVLSAIVEFLYKSKLDSERSRTSFGSALRSKVRLSFKGHVDHDNRAGSLRRRSHSSVTYTYRGPTKAMGGTHGFDENNTHTEV